VIRYLLDSSGLWRLLRDEALRASWSDVITSGAVGSCHPQRTEFRRSARGVADLAQMTDMFDDLYPDVPVPRTAWRWASAAQFLLARSGAHRAPSTVDLLVCSIAAHSGTTVLHDDSAASSTPHRPASAEPAVTPSRRRP
jgi:predicted nucleic acid-binding protein